MANLINKKKKALIAIGGMRGGGGSNADSCKLKKIRRDTEFYVKKNRKWNENNKFLEYNLLKLTTPKIEHLVIHLVKIK